MSQPTTRYGAGLPRVGERQLAAHELSSIRRSLRLALVQTALTLGAVLVGLVSALGYRATGGGGLAEQLGGPLGVAAVVTGFIGAFGAIVGGRRHWKWAAAIGLLYMMCFGGAQALGQADLFPKYLTWAIALSTVVVGLGYGVTRALNHARVLSRRRHILTDLDAGFVEQFEGDLQAASVDAALRRLLGSDPIGPRHRVEILPTSGTIVRLDGRIPDELDIAYLADVAPSQPHAFRAALPEGVTRGAQVSSNLQRRSLSPAERTELGEHIKRLRRRNWQLFAVVAGTLLAMGWQFTEAGGPAGLLRAPCLAWYVLAGFTVFGYTRRARAAARLESDSKLRWVVTVESSPTSPPTLEVLPVSQLAWTENASPASWRTVPL